MTGTLRDGRSFTLADASERGLCLTIEGVNIGCDQSTVVIDDPTTVRVTGDVVEPHAIAYGYLPEGATDVYALLDQDQRASGATLNSPQGVWALPLPAGYAPDNPVARVAVVYVLADGTEIPASAPT